MKKFTRFPFTEYLIMEGKLMARAVYEAAVYVSKMIENGNRYFKSILNFSTFEIYLIL